jgi:hypothetical protein
MSPLRQICAVTHGFLLSSGIKVGLLLRSIARNVGPVDEDANKGLEVHLTVSARVGNTLEPVRVLRQTFESCQHTGTTE